MTDVAAEPRSKAEERRRQILDAACACVRKAGFHGASMAEIAQAANLSVGQIYRYFQNKEAIVAAIVDQDLAAMREKFARFESEPGSMVDILVGECPMAVCKSYDPERAALMLEVLAEAARNPRVGAIVQAADAAERALSRQLLNRMMPPGCSEAEITARGEVLGIMFEGMAARSVNNPAGDCQAIGQLIGQMMRYLMSLPPQDETVVGQ